ncbi:hypothetical protein K466DRAFT_9351 [Polyporus arcularius HHB13444]|uniref:Uncharacterized protein n=1 Tax=Polyporus arcularius HHB13444 TaxID=1314778 RepID=A0A5C3NUF7_9APHY|nr:hypothetical protein K466DRAFT_9351 [Polyporus arcularius HHB13444]
MTSWRASSHHYPEGGIPHRCGRLLYADPGVGTNSLITPSQVKSSSTSTSSPSRTRPHAQLCHRRALGQARRARARARGGSAYCKGSDTTRRSGEETLGVQKERDSSHSMASRIDLSQLRNVFESVGAQAGAYFDPHE